MELDVAVKRIVWDGNCKGNTYTVPNNITIIFVLRIPWLQFNVRFQLLALWHIDF
jgi:hypothetical protein